VPDSKALADFLINKKRPTHSVFPTFLSLSSKLLGAGEYVVESQMRRWPGHFGLAVKDYTHSTAPNRRSLT